MCRKPTVYRFCLETIEDSNDEAGFEVYIKPEEDFVVDTDRSGFESEDNDEVDNPQRLSLIR